MPRYEEAVKLWQSWNIQTEADLALRLDSFRILFAYHSGKIENDEINYHDTREIFENGKVINYTGSTRTLFEQQNQKTCYELLRPKILAKEPLSLPLVRTIHRTLTEGTYDEQEDLAPLVTFLEDQTVKTWSRFLKPPAGNVPPRKGLNFFMN